MTKHLQLALFVLLTAALLFTDVMAQNGPQEVIIRELNEYPTPLTSFEDLDSHPLTGVPVVFEAVVVSYPKSSGFASATEANLPGRIHVFVEDINGLDMGRDGMAMHIVEGGDQRETLENLVRGDVVRVEGTLTFFQGIVVQFDPSLVTPLGNVFIDPEYEGLDALLQPRTIPLSDLNSPAGNGQFTWNVNNYSRFISQYVRIEGAEIISRFEAETGRPRFIGSADGVVAQTTDISLRFRNDRDNYAFDPETGEGRGYNYRRPAVDGPYVPPPAGAVVDWSGFVVVNTFDPDNIDVSPTARTLRINPFEDGFVWINDGDNPDDRVAPPGWPNDLVVLGFAPIVENLTFPQPALAGQAVDISVDVILPEDDYTLNSVTLTYTARPYTADTADEITVEMTPAGNTFSAGIGSFDAFDVVDFSIRVVTTTPEGIETASTVSDTIFIESATQAFPPVFSPAAGEYINFVEVSLSSPDEEAAIYFTMDGSDPTTDSPLYTAPILVEQTTTIKAIAAVSGVENSPVNERTYEVEVAIEEFATLAGLRGGDRDGTLYEYTGEAVVTYWRTARNQKYIQDETGAILIDDAPGRITEFYAIGDLMSNVRGDLSVFQGTVQFRPATDPGGPVGNIDFVPPTFSLADITVTENESMLVRIPNVSFVGAEGAFEGGTNYQITDPSLGEDQTVILRTNFPESDYIGLDIPEGEFTLTAIVGNFNGTLQMVPRFITDFDLGATSTEPGERPNEFSLDQNYPNPFNPTTNIRYNLAEATNVTLSVYDILGRRVAMLVNEHQAAGQYIINFDASRLASGTYIYRIDAGNFVSTRKMMLVK
ncbi:Por secretion system C-terminal sorting domain-containing protein [Cyclonatronum proteinivorum]|uniref:Por secretion system C-terminal sorting domain-containing protein n=1 Tax=Cyclonatronum proteinivorum TaxID=1457365 RepID=A0A345UNS1_9BACT|nr:chitobiase/beta-hexosaminidase C-terminal domain-containing protein [Cyclonatronum proteinivorum]AXJ02123.1 Por secretion system C-terminal sorting domain-containing protein [Cyclonatronum proteinivorum]